MLIPFGDFLPDLGLHGNPGSPYVINVLPFKDGYESFPLGATSSASSNALTAYCRGVGSFRSSANTRYDFFGDETKLYRLTGGAFDDVSSATYTTAAGE